VEEKKKEKKKKLKKKKLASENSFQDTFDIEIFRKILFERYYMQFLKSLF